MLQLVLLLASSHRFCLGQVAMTTPQYGTLSATKSINLVQPIPSPSPPPQRQAAVSPGLTGPPAVAAVPPARRPVKSAALAAAFGDDDDEAKPKRRLIPLQYTPAELVGARVSLAFLTYR